MRPNPQAGLYIFAFLLVKPKGNALMVVSVNRDLLEFA